MFGHKFGHTFVHIFGHRFGYNFGRNFWQTRIEMELLELSNRALALLEAGQAGAAQAAGGVQVDSVFCEEGLSEEHRM